MIALGVSQALEGSSTNAATVNCTVTGLLMTNASPPVVTSYEALLVDTQLGSSVGSLYGPGASATALISSIHLFNTGAQQTVSLYIGGATALYQIVTLVIPANGWAQYEDGDGWSVFNSSGLAVISASNPPVTAYRNATGTAGINEYTIFNGSTASQIITLPTTPPDATVNFVSNYASVVLTLKPGGSDTLNSNGDTNAAGNYLAVDQTVSYVYSAIEATWYQLLSGANSTAAVVVTATQAINSTVPQNITALTVPVVPGGVYQFDAEVIAANSATGATAIGVVVTVPAGASLTYDAYGQTNGTTAKQLGVATTTTIQTGFITTSGFTGFIKCHGVVVAGTSSTQTGVIQVQINSVASVSSTAATATVEIGSYLIVNKI